jgi:D-glycero-alpha-D-manno-heptose 1-phosphate guanylyltransferase
LSPVGLTRSENLTSCVGSKHHAGLLAEVDAVVLAGGLGTRLRSVLSDRPKALALIHGRPFLAYLFDQLINAGIFRVVLCLGFGSRQIRECFGESYRGLCIVHSEEPTPLGTAGALRLALPILRSNPVLVINGDSYCEVDLESFWTSHQKRRASVSMVLARVPDTDRFGRIELGARDAVISFQEKGNTSGDGLINAGLYLIDRALIDEIPADISCSLEREIFPSWIGRGFYGFATTAKFLDIGTPEAYASSEAFFRAGDKATENVPGRRTP